jgi:hypothetical protein
VARYGVSIEKTTLYRGVQQKVTNVYYYDGNVPSSDTATLNDLVDEIVAIEKAIHTNDYTWTRARVWTQVGTAAQNEMIIDRLLSGNGTLTAHSQIDKERAILFRFRAGVDNRGRPVYLRKWFHCNGTVILGAAPSNGMLANTAGLTQGQRDAGVTVANTLKTINAGAGNTPMNLVAKNGRAIDGATATHPFFENRQLGEDWRGG